jgi:hypothetical protein
MTTPEHKRKNVKGVDFVRFEPHGLNLVNVDPKIIASFEQVGHIRFCEKLQGYNKQVVREFGENFYGIESKVGNLYL